VVLWGDTGSVGPKPQLIAVTHHISHAAATFKTHALAAARAQPSTDIAVEKFLATRAIWQAAGSTAADVEPGPRRAQPYGSRIRHEDEKDTSAIFMRNLQNGR
jgi:hypothetical protein